MRLDLQARTTYAFLFGIGGLIVMLGGSLAGLPVSEVLAGIFGSIVLAAIGVEAAQARGPDRDGRGDEPSARKPAEGRDG